MEFFKIEKVGSKLFFCLIVVWFPYVGMMTALSLRHLAEIEGVASKGLMEALISVETRSLESYLTQESARLEEVFTNIQKDVHVISTLAQHLLNSPSKHSFRNGSRYTVDKYGVYGNHTADGHSALYVPRYHPSLDPVISVTESIDLLLKPLLEKSNRAVLSWIIHSEGVIRAYPWKSFVGFPNDEIFTSWSFYFLAGPEHNPGKTVIFTPVYVDPLTGESMVSCISPVYSDGKHVATVGVDITVQDLLKEISGVSFTPGTMVALLSGEEVIAASKNIAVSSVGSDMKTPFPRERLGNTSFAVLRELTFNRNENIAEVRRVEIGAMKAFIGTVVVPPMGWEIVFIAPEDEVLSPAFEHSQKIINETEEVGRNFIHVLLYTLFSVGALLYMIIFYRSKGLNALLDGIRALGSGNLSHRVKRSGMEYGQLGKALNVMAENLQIKNRELKQAIVEVEQGRKLSAVGRLAAGIAHEVNNPMATISTYTQTILSLDDLPKAVSSRLEKVMREIARIQDMLRNLLDMSRTQPPTKVYVNLDALVSEVAEMAKYEASGRGIEFVMSLDTGIREVEVDISGIKQVLWNLLNNSFDALGTGGVVKVSTYVVTTREGRLNFILEVEDDGPGIPENILSRIFEPFVTTKDVEKGTGLGLAIVYSLVQNHGGQIEVTNIVPRGCSVRVILPGKKE
jgi:signal transduction histidine kinase